MASSLLVLAQAAPGGGPGMLIFIGLLFAIMYFLVIAPQSKQQKQHKQLLTTLKKGDKVVTQGGLLGKIHTVGDQVLMLEIANGVRVEVLKTSVQSRTGEEPAAAPAAAVEKKEDK